MLKRIKIFYILCVSVILFAPEVFAEDEIILKIGTIIKGKIISETDTSITFEETIGEGKAQMTILRAEIKEARIEEPQVFTEAKTLQQKGDYDGAIKAYGDVLTQFSRYDWAMKALLGMAQCKEKKELWSDAERTYRDFLNKYSASSLSMDANMGLSNCLIKLNKFEEAIVIQKNLIDLKEGKDAAQVQYMLGETLLARGEVENALLAFLRVVVVYYDYPEWSSRATFKAGISYEKLNDFKRAGESYQDVINNYPKCEFIKDAKKKLEEIKGK